MSDYGFSKLLDLFEAIPHVVDVSVNIKCFCGHILIIIHLNFFCNVHHERIIDLSIRFL